VEVWATPIDGRIWQHLFSLDDSIMQVTEPAQTVNGRARQERLRQERHNRKTPYR